MLALRSSGNNVPFQRYDFSMREMRLCCIIVPSTWSEDVKNIIALHGTAFLSMEPQAADFFIGVDVVVSVDEACGCCESVMSEDGYEHVNYRMQQWMERWL